MSLLAIVGRPNVGKSTLFNRLVGMRQAIVDETAGVTRDRHYGRCEWCGTEFSVVDTGGYTSNSDDIFEEEIRKQVVLAIEEAHVVLFMVEAAAGITDYDEEIADILRRSGKPVILAVNKVDSGDKMYAAGEAEDLEKFTKLAEEFDEWQKDLSESDQKKAYKAVMAWDEEKAEQVIDAVNNLLY